ncbi:fam-a protein [Plasmodium vinckei lentum]|uniref:Fam-a protein n=1 Tax=Plasmodium vinckei lentum TaxID=138297 RepID=A0A6V7RS66_PLAVN|nr:fam-a protein [Plasmodium vinckei lentum]
MNKFYIQVVFFLLSIFVYANNEALATEPAPRKDKKSKSKVRYSTSEEIYEKNKDRLCTDSEETKQAIKLMNEAVIHLAYHAKSEDDYEYRKWSSDYNKTFKRKKHGDTVIQRISFKYDNSSKYNEIINLFWNPSFANNFNNGSVKRKIVRAYNPNLVIIQQRYKNGFRDHWKYFYALAAKFDVTEEKAIIAMTSPNINDHHPSEKEYKNTIIESANLFKIDIDSSESIRSGKLEKTFLNIAGFIIEKNKWDIDITYLESIDGHISNFNKLFIEKALIKLLH